jgi:hypothetical protein
VQYQKLIEQLHEDPASHMKCPYCEKQSTSLLRAFNHVKVCLLSFLVFCTPPLIAVCLCFRQQRCGKMPITCMVEHVVYAPDGTATPKKCRALVETLGDDTPAEIPTDAHLARVYFADRLFEHITTTCCATRPCRDCGLDVPLPQQLGHLRWEDAYTRQRDLIDRIKLQPADKAPVANFLELAGPWVKPAAAFGSAMPQLSELEAVRCEDWLDDVEKWHFPTDPAPGEVLTVAAHGSVSFRLPEHEVKRAHAPVIGPLVLPLPRPPALPASIAAAAAAAAPVAAAAAPVVDLTDVLLTPAELRLQAHLNTITPRTLSSLVAAAHAWQALQPDNRFVSFDRRVALAREAVQAQVFDEAAAAFFVSFDEDEEAAVAAHVASVEARQARADPDYNPRSR